MTPKKLMRLMRGFLHKYIAKWLPDHQNWPELVKNRQAKITPKIAHSALPGDLTVVTTATNHFIFIK